MTKLKKKKQFLTRGDYPSIAKFLGQKSTSIPGGIFGVYFLHFKIGIHLRHDFSRNPSRRSAENWLANTVLKLCVR